MAKAISLLGAGQDQLRGSFLLEPLRMMTSMPSSSAAESRVEAEIDPQRFGGGGALASLLMRNPHSNDIEVRDVDASWP